MIENEQISETQVRALMGHEFDHRGMGRTKGKLSAGLFKVESTLRDSTKKQVYTSTKRFKQSSVHEFSENFT